MGVVPVSCRNGRVTRNCRAKRGAKGGVSPVGIPHQIPARCNLAPTAEGIDTYLFWIALEKPKSPKRITWYSFPMIRS